MKPYLLSLLSIAFIAATLNSCKKDAANNSSQTTQANQQHQVTSTLIGGSWTATSLQFQTDPTNAQVIQAVPLDNYYSSYLDFSIISFLDKGFITIQNPTNKYEDDGGFTVSADGKTVTISPTEELSHDWTIAQLTSGTMKLYLKFSSALNFAESGSSVTAYGMYVTFSR